MIQEEKTVAWDRVGVTEVIESADSFKVKPAGIHCWTKGVLQEKQNHTEAFGRSTCEDGMILTETEKAEGACVGRKSRPHCSCASPGKSLNLSEPQLPCSVFSNIYLLYRIVVRLKQDNM